VFEDFKYTFITVLVLAFPDFLKLFRVKTDFLEFVISGELN